MLRMPNSTPLLGQAIDEIIALAKINRFSVSWASEKDTEFILSHPEVQGVSFTGSTASGEKVAVAAAKNLKRANLELGGSDPFIVLPDADIDLAVELAVGSRLAHCGQVCFSAKRFIVQEGIFYEFAEKLKARVDLLKIGDPLDHETNIGPLSSVAIFERLRDQIRRGLEFEGPDGERAQLLFGGEVQEEFLIHHPTAIKVPGNQAPLNLNVSNSPEDIALDLLAQIDSPE